jgi:hypothetical protein
MTCSEVAFVRQQLDKASIVVSNFDFVKAMPRGDLKQWKEGPRFSLRLFRWEEFAAPSGMGLGGGM